ncbi:MAG TPA: hypothetical protein VGG91_09760 [Myxococcaceae bacterium]|jgi:hypothetical protein
MTLRAGRAVEQWLGREESSAGAILRWLQIKKEKSGHIVTTLFEVYDVGSDQFVDLYEFPDVDADASFRASHVEDNEAAALDYAVTMLGADEAHFVNAGVVQDEYRASRSKIGKL